MKNDRQSDDRTFHATHAILAWLWPGLGHIAHGQRQRGILIMIGVLGLFLSGLLIGGLDVVDRRNDRLWFMAQAGCGPVSFAADYARAMVVPPINRDWTIRGDAALRDGYVEGNPEIIAELRRPSLGHVNEIGTLYIALAGLMNIVVVLDALYHVPADNIRRRSTDRSSA